MTNGQSDSTPYFQPEPRWPGVVGVLATTGIYLCLPDRLIPGPDWLVLVVICFLLAATIAAHRQGSTTLNFRLGVLLSAVMTAGVIWSLGILIGGLLTKRAAPTELLRSASTLWASNILVFASWYWGLDAGGPHKRERRRSHTEGAFLFPQMMQGVGDQSSRRAWKPGFMDYLFLAFNTSTAFSPADVPVPSRWAKGLMMVQSLISLSTIAILAARAINVL